MRYGFSGRTRGKNQFGLLGVLLKILDEHPRYFFRRVPPEGDGGGVLKENIVRVSVEF